MADDDARLAQRLHGLELEVARLRGLVEGAGKPPGEAPTPPEQPPQPEVPAPSPSAPAQPARPRGDEVSLVGPWMARIGAVALVVGAAFAFKYAIDRGLIGPTARVVLGLVAGGILAAGGEWARRREWAGWAQAVSGGAIGLWFLSAWAAFELYGLISAPIALVTFSAITLAGALLALRHDSEPLAILAAVTAYLGPFLIGTFRIAPLGAYVLVVDLGVIGLASIRSWPSLSRVALVGTWITVSAAAGFSESDGAETKLVVPLLFGGAFFAIFIGYALRRAIASSSSVLRDVLIGNSFAFLGYGLALLEAHADDWLGTFAASLGVLHLVIAGLLPARTPPAQQLVRALRVLGVAFVVVAVPLQFDGPLLAATWTVQAVVLVAFGAHSGSRLARFTGVALLLLAIFQALVVEFQLGAFQPGAAYHPGRLFLSGESALLALQVIAAVVTARLLPSTDPTMRTVRQALFVVAHIVAIVWLTMETLAVFEAEPGSWSIRLREERAFAVTAVWAVYAAGALVGGVIGRSLLNRLVSVGLFGVVILKLVFSDLWLVGPLYRTIAFIGLGVVLLAGSFVYHRFRGFILEGRDDGTGRAESISEPTQR